MQDSDGAVCDKHSNKLEALLSELRKLKLRIAEVEEQLVALDGGWSDARKRSFDCGSELLTRQDSLVEHPSAGTFTCPATCGVTIWAVATNRRQLTILATAFLTTPYWQACGVQLWPAQE